MTPNEFQIECLRTFAGAGTSTPAEHFKFGADLAAGEAGELLNIANKVHWQGHPLDGGKREHGLEEAGDVLWGLCVALVGLGYSLEDCMAYNRAKLAKRYGTGTFSVRDSMSRIDVVDGRARATLPGDGLYLAAPRAEPAPAPAKRARKRAAQPTS